MTSIETDLGRQGYRILNISYPSRRNGIDALAQYVDQQLVRADVWNTHDRVHFVTHSMGGLVAARYLDAVRDRALSTKMGRVVMLAPPNGGSEVADWLYKWPPYRWIYGPAGQELTTSIRAGVHEAPQYGLGIIAGNTGWPYILGNLLIQRPHDGRVAVDRTVLDGMMDNIVLPATHSFIMRKPQVQRQVSHFLATGRFQHG
jgi:triacylglycerol lipase